MPSFIINEVSVEHLKVANYLAIGTDSSDGSASDQALGTEVARSPILTVLFGETYFEYKALIPEEQLPKLSSAAPDDAVREVGLFWNGSSSLGSGKLLYRSTVFIKQVTVGNDLFIVLRLSPTVSTSVIAPTRPDAPASPTLSSPSPQAIRVEWIAPNDNGSDITKYDIRYREEGTFSWTTILGQRGLQYTITGLTSETEYEVRIRAVNAIGNSFWSNIVTRDTIPEYELDAGLLFLLNKRGLAHIITGIHDMYNFHDAEDLKSVNYLYSVPRTGSNALAYDNESLIILQPHELFLSGSTVRHTLYRITQFSTTSPIHTSLGSFEVTGHVHGMAYGNNKLMLAVNYVATQNTRIYVITDLSDLSTLDHIGNVGGTSRRFSGMTFDGSRFLGAESSGEIYEVDESDGSVTLLTTLPAEVTPIASIAYSGRLLVTKTNSNDPAQLYTVENLSTPTVTNRGKIHDDVTRPVGLTWVPV